MLLSIKWLDRLAFPVFDRAQWNNLIDWYRENGHYVKESKTDLQHWLERDSWRVDWDEYGNYTLYVGNSSMYSDRGNFFKYILKISKEAEGVKPSGIHSINYFKGMFKERTGVSIQSAFGGVNRLDFRGFQYTPISYFDYKYSGIILHHFYKCDVSAAYPFQACKTLPDSHGCKTLPGRVHPTKNYPFAYYIKSNQLAIFGEFSTFDYLDHPLNHCFVDFEKFKKTTKAKYKQDYNDRFHYVNINPDEDITILMKASAYTFEQEFRSQYERRKVDELAKMICNIAIGCLSSTNYKVNSIHQRHITSVIYARHMVQMMKYYDEIKAAGGVPVNIVTDSIAWLSKKDLHIGTKEKKLGAFYLEVADTSAYFKAHGVYAIKYPEGDIRIWHQGYQVKEKFFQTLHKVSDIDKIEDTSIKITFNRINYKFVEVVGDGVD